MNIQNTLLLLLVSILFLSSSVSPSTLPLLSAADSSNILSSLLSAISPSSSSSSSSSTPTGNFRYEICDEARNAFKVSSIDISPNPPQRGNQLTLHIAGTLDASIDTSSIVAVVVKYRSITILKQSFDVCQELGKVSDAPVQCPIEAGEKDWTFSFDIPNEIIPGPYTVQAVLNNQDQAQIVCTKIFITF